MMGGEIYVGYRYESIAKLHDPLAGRAVIDGTSGLPVQRANCLPAARQACQRKRKNQPGTKPLHADPQ